MAQDDIPRRDHHFLYYIFRMDQKVNPMEESKAIQLRQALQRMLNAFPKRDKK